jgi:hypothetical protein
MNFPEKEMPRSKEGGISSFLTTIVVERNAGAAGLLLLRAGWLTLI